MISEKSEADPSSLIASHDSLSKDPVSAPKVIAGVVFNVAFYALLLFVPAGTLHWWRAWVFLAVTVAVIAGAIFSILPGNAELFSQRARRNHPERTAGMGPSSRNSAGCFLRRTDRFYSARSVPVPSGSKTRRLRFISRTCALRCGLVDHDSSDESQPLRRASG